MDHKLFQNELFEETDKLFIPTEKDPLTLWLTDNSGKCIFNHGGKSNSKNEYSFIGFVGVGTNSRLQAIGLMFFFSTNNYYLALNNRVDKIIKDKQKLQLLYQNISSNFGKTIKNRQGDEIKIDLSNEFKPFFSSKTIDYKSLAEKIKSIYYRVFSIIDQFDNQKGTKFRDVLKISSKKYINKRKTSYSKLGKQTPIIPTVLPLNVVLPLNLILYGPPGTGKTYHTIDKAIEIIDGIKNSHNTKRFRDLKDEGRIIFTTFHQSMSYEDFIEGIKPETDDDGNVTYEVKPGIFKQLCEKAKLSQTSSNFNEAYNTFINDLTSAGYYGNNPSQFVTSNKSTFGISVNSKGNLSLFTGNPLKKQGTITKDNLELRFLGNSNYNYWESYFKRIIEHLEDRYQLQQENRPNNNNYVLIIDEINRGNVANIFGELITLIEDDKRGKLSVKLPYSNKDFSVPKNLYIIGTMNTADRSVEALDTALRRRFSFEEMMPKPALLGEYKIKNGNVDFCTFKDILEKINSRIEVLKDRDHLIGHSYFMIKVKDDQGNEIDKESFNLNDKNDKKMLISIFFDKIIPLLQEYFYGDYEKIQMVLGNGFVNNKKPDVIFAGNKTFDELQEQSYSIVDFDRNNPNTFDLTNALALMMNKNTKEELDTQGNGES